MKKITLFLVALLSIMTVNAATKTIYCKMTHDWWKADNAAIGAYAWSDGGGTNASWPGVRMNKVSGETDLWSVDIDTDKYQKVIFTRVNASGTLADWGAKTGDQIIPTDDKNLFTITSTTAVWGNPGVVGSWSVYSPNAPKTYKDITITVVANAQPKIHYWEGGDKMVASDWETKPDMVATGEANTYSYTIKDVDAAIGMKYIVVVGDVQTADLYTNIDVTANFKDLLPQVVVMGVNNWNGTDKMTVSDDYKTATITLNLTVQDYEWKLTVNGEWFGGSKYVITRDKNSIIVADNGDGASNGKLTADLAGEYVFTYTYATKNLTVTYPAIPAVPTIVEGTKLYVQTPFEESASASRPHKVVFGKFTVPTGGSTGGGLKMATSTVTEVEMTKVYTETGQYNIWEVTAPAGTQDSIFNVIVYKQANPCAYIVSLKYDGEKNLFKLPNDYKIQSDRYTGIIPATEADGEWDIYKEVTVEPEQPEVKYTIIEGTKLYVQTAFEESASASRPHKVVFGNFTVPTGGSTGGGLKPMAASTVTEVEMTKVYTETGQYNIWEVTAPAGTQDSIFNVIVYKKTNACAYIVSLKYDGEKNLFKLPNDYKVQTNKTGIIPATEADGEWDIYVPDYTGGDATNVENATVTNIFVQNGMIVMDGEYQIYTITGQNVTDMNGSLENGIYIVKSFDSAIKVIVK